MKYQPPYGSSDPGADYVDRNTASATSGSRIPAAFPNFVQREIVKVIESAGLTPDDTLQMASAIQNGGMNFGVAGGSADAVTIALSPTVTALTPGLVIGFRAAATNTSAMTINVDNLGAVSILRSGGSATEPGDIPGGSVARLIYDGAAFRVLGPTAGELVTAQAIATQPQALAGLLNDVLMTPLRVADVLSAKVIGISQTWQAVVRAANTVYQNTTGRPICCAGEAGWQSWGGFMVSSDNVTWLTILDANENDYTNPFSVIVPPGWYYKLGDGVVRYLELR